MLKIGDIVKRPDGKRYILIPDQGHMGDVKNAELGLFRPHDGYLTISDAKMENLEKEKS